METLRMWMRREDEDVQCVKEKQVMISWCGGMEVVRIGRRERGKEKEVAV